MGSRFVASQESSAHQNFKNALINAGPGDTRLMMKNLVPVRLLKNPFYEQIRLLEERCAGRNELAQVLGKAALAKACLKAILSMASWKSVRSAP